MTSISTHTHYTFDQPSTSKHRTELASAAAEYRSVAARDAIGKRVLDDIITYQDRHHTTGTMATSRIMMTNKEWDTFLNEATNRGQSWPAAGTRLQAAQWDILSSCAWLADMP